MEWSVNACGDQEPVYDRCSIAGPDQVDIVSICFWMLLQHLLDQLKDEADIVCFAPLVVNVPAFPVTAWGNNYCTMAEIIQSIQVA